MAEPSVVSTDGASTNNVATLENIQAMLKAKDDTKRFVGLALLRSVLSASPQLQEDPDVLESLWTSISPKFLDRLLKTGSNPSNKDAKDMLDLAVHVLHTFAVLLPESLKSQPKFTNRIPFLVTAVLHR